MRTLITLALCGAVAVPGLAVAQSVAPAAEGELAPNQPPFSDPVAAPPPPMTARPAPKVEAAKITPPAPQGPTTVAPVIVEAKSQPESSDMTRKVAVTVGGVLGGVAGAAGGPVGKFAGSLVGKHLAKSLVDKKEPDTPQLDVTQVASSQGAPSAADAGKPALAEPATAPALVAVSDPRASQP
ncbi:MAG: hypothetical protein JF588_06980 [Caulobacterales bacterium]|nr:hypothetical protein [Caulobacterales bacterium]